MTVNIANAVDEAQYVKSAELGTGIWAIQAWYGGTMVRMFIGSECEGGWREAEPWSVSDDKGRPVDQATIEKHMEMQFAEMEDI